MTVLDRVRPAGDARPTGRGGRRWPAAAIVAVLVATWAHLWVAASALRRGVPTFSYDEVGTLMISRAMAGLPSPEVTGAGYFPGSAALVAPVWWLADDPDAVYRVAIGLGVVVALVTIWPLARLATRLGLTMPQSVAAAAVVMALPARSLQADLALAEKPLFLLLVLAVLAAARLAERPTYGRAAILGVLVAAAYFTHVRALTIVAAAAVWLLLLAQRHPRVALVGGLTLGTLSWGAGRLAHHLNGLVDPNGFSQGAGFVDDLQATRPGLVGQTLLGQSWEQLVSTYGLAIVGILALAGLVRAELRHRSPGPAGLIALATLALFSASVLAWAVEDQLYATSWRRLDAWIYGRYVDPVFALLALVGLAAIVRGVGGRMLRATWCLALAVAVPTVLWLAPQAPTWAFITPGHIPGAMAWSWALPEAEIPPGLVPTLGNANRFWLLATLTALVPLAVLVAARRRPVLVGATVLALAVPGVVAADQASGRYQHELGLRPALTTMLRDIAAAHPGTTVSYIERCPDDLHRPGGRRNRYAWLLLPTVVSRDPAADIVIACPGAPTAATPGAVPLPESAYGELLAWVRPGPLQDALRSEGLLPAAGRPGQVSVPGGG